MRELVKIPKQGDIIDGPTGGEVVIRVDTTSGARITVWDTLGRQWTRFRADDGWWTVIGHADNADQ